MTGMLLSLLPDGTLPVVLVFVGLALIVGLVSRQAAFSIVGCFVLFALLSPFLESLSNALPTGILIILFCIFALSIFKLVLSLLFGKGPTDHFLGQLMYGVFTLPFRLIGFLLRGGR